MKVAKVIEFDVTPTPHEMADDFLAMDAQEKAAFFNHIADMADCLPMQLQYVKESEELTSKGKSVMMLIGEYGE